jgi:hypothetical protein
MSRKEIIELVVAGILGWIGATVYFRFNPTKKKNESQPVTPAE